MSSTGRELPGEAAIAGFHGPVPAIDELLPVLDEVAAAHRDPDAPEDEVVLQLVDARKVHGADHLLQAVHLAQRSREQGTHLADDPAVEVLLYAAGTRQIDEALAFLGLEEGPGAIAAIAPGMRDPEALWRDLAERLGWTRDDAVLEGGPDVLDAWGIPEDEREALPPERHGELVLERVALLDVEK